MGDNSQTARRLLLLRILHDRTDEDHGLCIASLLTILAENGFNACATTIRRDIAYLRTIHYIDPLNGNETQPCFSIKGRRSRGSYTYRLEKHSFTAAEQMLLVDAVQGCHFLTQNMADNLCASIMCSSSTSNADIINRRIHIKNRVHMANEKVLDYMHIAQTAITQGKKLWFRYFDLDFKLNRSYRDTLAGREVTPVEIMLSDGFCYIVGFGDNHDDASALRIDRIEALRISETDAEDSDRVRSFCPSQFERVHFGMFTGRTRKVTLSFVERFTKTMVDTFGPEAILQATGDEDLRHARVNVIPGAPFYGWLIGVREGIKLESPQDVLDGFKAHLMQSIYEYGF